MSSEPHGALFLLFIYFVTTWYFSSSFSFSSLVCYYLFLLTYLFACLLWTPAFLNSFFLIIFVDYFQRFFFLWVIWINFFVLLQASYYYFSLFTHVWTYYFKQGKGSLVRFHTYFKNKRKIYLCSFSLVLLCDWLWWFIFFFCSKARR